MERRIIRLTESELHQVIAESVKEIVNEAYRSGHVGNDGNGMVGGSWWHKTGVVSVNLDGGDIAAQLSEMMDLDEDTTEALYRALCDTEYKISCKSESGADDSVGMGEYTDIESFEDLDGLDIVLEQVLGPEGKEKALDELFDMLRESNDIDWE